MTTPDNPTEAPAPSAVFLGILVALLLAILPGRVMAGTPVELPPGEDPADWQDALRLGRQLVPELELGDAVGAGPNVRILVRDDGWLLDIQTAWHHAEPVIMPAPASQAARLELLLVCADALAHPQVPSSVSSASSPSSPATSDPWQWRPLLVRAGFDVLPGDHRPLQFQLEPFALRWRQLGFSPMLAMAVPTRLAETYKLGTTQLGLEAWWSTSGTLRWRSGVGLAVDLRELRSQGQVTLRDWTFAPSVSSQLDLPIHGGWRGLLGLRLSSAVPPTILELEGQEVLLPTWRFQLLAGVRLPWPYTQP